MLYPDQQQSIARQHLFNADVEHFVCLCISIYSQSFANICNTLNRWHIHLPKREPIHTTLSIDGGLCLKSSCVSCNKTCCLRGTAPPRLTWLFNCLTVTTSELRLNYTLLPERSCTTHTTPFILKWLRAPKYEQLMLCMSWTPERAPCKLGTPWYY